MAAAAAQLQGNTVAGLGSYVARRRKREGLYSAAEIHCGFQVNVSDFIRGKTSGSQQQSLPPQRRLNAGLT